MMRKQSGFTLIELLIVIAVLGILAAVVIPNVGKFISSGNVSAAKAELSAVRTAVSAAMADAGVATLAGGTVKSDTDLSDFPLVSYLAGGLVKLKGTYSVGTNGLVTITAYTGLTLPADAGDW